MADIVQELTIEVAPERVFTALTRQSEIALWWARYVVAEPEVGSLVEVRFGTTVFELEVARLDSGVKVDWLLRKGPPHWKATNITWDLASLSNGTRLLFGHNGFATADSSFEETRKNWKYYLDSLKLYLETGKGTPNVD